MTYPTAKLSKLGRLDLALESVFATTAGEDAYLRCEPVDRSGLVCEAIVDAYQRVGFGSSARIIGAHTGSLSLKTQLAGYSAALPEAAPAMATHPWAELIAWAMGDAIAGGYEATDPSTSTTSILKGVDLSSIVPGQAIAYLTAANGYQVAWVKAVDNVATPDEATLLQTMVAVPTGNPTTIYGSITCAVTSGLSRYVATTAESFRLTLLGHAATDKVIAYGCLPNALKMTYERGKPLMLDLGMGVAHWADIGSGGAPAAGTWAYPAAEKIGAAWVTWGSSAATTKAINKVDFDLGLSLQPIGDMHAASGIGGWFVADRKPRCTFSVIRSYADEVTDWAAQTGAPFVITLGSQPGKMFSLCIPNARIIEYPTPADEAGALVSKITLEACDYSGDTGSNALANTICRFAIL